MAHLLHELQNPENVENINEIQFSLFSHQDIKRGSVADILTPDRYDGNIPKNNGLFDHNMGSIDASIICPIDEKRAELCPGYFGKIDLGLPVFNHNFVGYVEKILKCVCFRCSNLLIDKTDHSVIKQLEGKKGHNRFVSCIALAAKNKKCSFNGGCFVLQPTKYVRLNASNIKDKNNIVQIFGEFSDNALKSSTYKQQNFTPLICYKIFKKIKDEDVDFLGLSSKYSRPEWMIITSLAVPPPAMRPSIRQSDNQRSEDDLTYALDSIIKANKLLKQVLENSSNNNKKISDYQGYLQYLVSTYMDNEIPGVDSLAQRSYRPLKALAQRLKGKEGRLRNNIMGKRVDYSARTVISVDPNINIDEYGVPQKIAMNLTFPEIVTRYNMKKLKSMVINGPKNYPGAKTVTKVSEEGQQRNISLKHVDVQQVADNLQIGDIVHRHLIDGDVCLFNRQPTLHRMSMMTHKIKILPYSTFRLNVTVCKPYNADFDGDEMNMHIPQSLQTFSELDQICLVPNHIISPADCKPILQIVQDTLLGAYALTINDVKLRKDQMNNLMMFSKRYNGILPEPEGIQNNQPYWSGKQLYSLILPDININQLKSIKIIRGKIIDGYLSNDSLGGDPAGLIKQIFNAYGKDTCNNFLNDTQKLITRWFMDYSFTVSFGDCTLNKEQRMNTKQIIKNSIEESFDLIKKAQHGVFANNLDDAYKALALESEMMKILSELDGKVKDYLIGNISKKNAFFVTSDKGSGSKGKVSNVIQIMGTVGQQSIWGSRIDDGFTHRTLPHYCRNDVSPEAKGFCANSYTEGLSPSEAFFHAMGGRMGTIDTAIKSVTGDTPIIIMENGIMKHVNIGNWIDEILDNNKDRVQNLPEKEMELLELDYEAHIPTTDLNGNVSWGIIKNITRHDPGKELYEIKTHGGRKVIVTESHSLLIWNDENNAFERKCSPDVHIGDFVPVSANLCNPPVMNNNQNFLLYDNHIDPSIFNASNDVIAKVINKIYLNIGSVSDNAIYFFSKYLRLLEDINICLSRFGIFGQILNNDTLVIKSKWVFMYNELINNSLNIIFDNNDLDFRVVNDTVLDPIVEINKVDISKYPKVYDLTIPSTLNFGLANGLHVVDTADSGYISKRFIKASEELMVNYDYTVRNSSNYIVQFGYGDDNFDPVKLERVPRIELIEYNDMKMKDVYKFEDIENQSYFENFMTPEAIISMNNDMNYKNILNDEYEELWDMRNTLRYNYFNNTEAIGDINTYIPINLHRVIPSQLIKFNVENYHLSDLTPQYVIDTYNKTFDDIIKYLPEKNENWKLFKIIFKSFLATKRVIKEYRMSKAVYDSIILLIKDKMLNALVQPGELVGIIGSQTLGEVSTQMTLNTHHSAGIGVGSLVITEGIPRLREIINISKKLKNKNMSIYLKEEFSNNKDNARRVQSKFAYTKLSNILSKTEILYDNSKGITDKNEDYEFIKSYKEFASLFEMDEMDDNALSPWILRLTFDKESLMMRKINVQEIQETIKESFHNEDEIECIFSDDSANDVVMRIRIKHEENTNFLDFMKDFEKQLIELKLRGIVDIDQIELSETNIIKYDVEGNIKPSKEWMFKTMGSNLLDVLSDDAIDVSRTITNDIIEFHEIFGIEATRHLIYKELMKVYSGGVNPRHIQMMSDVMTYRGKLMTIDRHGINKNSEIGPIGKASFEEVMNIFEKAAVFAEKDNMKGVSANIFAGQFCKAGTNAFDVIIDEDKIMEHVVGGDYEYKDTTDQDVDNLFEEAYSKPEKIDSVVDEDFEFGFGMEFKKEYSLTKFSDEQNILLKNNNKNIILEKSGFESSNYVNFENIGIEEETIEDEAPNVSLNDVDIEESDNENNINFNTIDIDDSDDEEEADLDVVNEGNNDEDDVIDDEDNDVEEVKPKTKKIRVAKKKNETPKIKK